MIQIILASLVLFGNMIYGYGLPGLADGAVNNNYNTATQGYGGVVFAEPTNIVLAEIDSQDNGYDASGGLSNVTLRLYARASGTPSHATDGTLLGTLQFVDVNQYRTMQIIPSDTTTEFNCAWWVIDTQVWAAATEMRFYTDDGGSTPTPAPEIPDVSGGAILQRSINDVTPLTWNGDELDDYKMRFYISSASPTIVLYQANLVHRGEYTGYYGVVGVGMRACYRYADSEIGLDTATLYCPENSVSGTNIINRDPHHYGAVVIIDTWMLQPGYYEITMTGSAHSTGSAADGLAAILAEYGHGLNKLLILIVPGVEILGD